MASPALTLSFDPRLFAATFGLIFVAELPDKTAFATLLLASRRRGGAVFAGAAAAFVVQTLVAVAFGSALALLPAGAVHAGAGGVFLLFAVAMWLRDEVEEEEARLMESRALSFWKEAAGAFVVVFLAEWGDLTQLATAAVEARTRSPVTVFAAAVLALWAVTGLAVAAGRRLKSAVRPEWLRKAAAVAFAAVGIVFLAKAYR